MSEAMKVQIITAHKGAWYSDRIGDVFKVSDTAEGYGYIVEDYTDGKYYAVRLTDVEFITDGDIGSSEVADAINSPNHYTQGGIEVIDIIAQTVAGYDDPFVAHCVGTATKYLNRAPFKHDDGGVEDLNKAAKYIDFAIEHLTKEER